MNPWVFLLFLSSLGHGVNTLPWEHELASTLDPSLGLLKRDYHQNHFLRRVTVSLSFFFIFTVPPRVSVDYDEVPVILGETLVLQCAAVGVPMPTITWVKDDKPLRSNDRVNITDDGALIIGAAIPQDVGEYHCVGRSPAGTDRALVTLWGEGGLCMKGAYLIL